MCDIYGSAFKRLSTTLHKCFRWSNETYLPIVGQSPYCIYSTLGVAEILIVTLAIGEV